MSKQDSVILPTSRDRLDTLDRPTKKRRTNVGKACEPCRRRRCKCDGVMPSCTTCTIYKDDCFWDPREDYRKPLSRQEVKALTVRVQQLERLLRDNGISYDGADGFRDGDDSSVGIRSKDDESEPSSDLRQWSQDHLVEGETGDLRVYGPTSAFRHLGKYSHERSGGLNVYNNSPPESPNILPYGYAKYLPQDVHFTEAQHDKALDRFFRYYASWCQRTNPILFQRDMYNALHTESHSKTSHYSPMLHNAILAIALGFSDEPYLRLPSTRRVFANKAKDFIDHEGMRPTVATVQALAHLASYHSLAAEHNLGWLYIGMALRCGVALGLNIDDTRILLKGNVSPGQARERNVTFWTTFIQEGLWAPYIGRSISLPEYTTHLPIVDDELDHLPWESKESFAANPLIKPQSGMISTTFVETVKLMKIGEKIMNTLYGLKADMSTLVRTGVINEISASLSSWLEYLPSVLKLHGDSPANGLPHILMLHLSYAWLVILLHRPFYRPLAGATRGAKPDESATPTSSNAAWAVKQCDTAALQVISLLQTWHRLHDLRFSPPTALQCCFIAGTTHLLSLASAQSQIEQNDALSRARQCIDLLRLMAVSWPAAQQKQTLLENLLAEYGLSIVSQRSTQISPAIRSTVLKAEDSATRLSNSSMDETAVNTSLRIDSTSWLSSTTQYSTSAPSATYVGEHGDQYQSYATSWSVNSGGARQGQAAQTLLAPSASATLFPPSEIPSAHDQNLTWDPTPFDPGFGDLDPETQALLDNILRPHLDVGMAQSFDSAFGV